MAELDIEDIYRLAPMQEGFVFHSIYEPDSQAYVVQFTCHCTGDINEDVFQRTWSELSRRHAVLRSSFVHEGVQNPVQVVLRVRSPEFTSVDLRHVGDRDATDRVAAYKVEDCRRGFDLQHDVLMRVTLFRLGESEYTFVWSFHHILLDGWSYGVLQRELIQIYQALAAGTEPDLPPPPPYANYVAFLNQWDRDSARDYWSRYLRGYSRTANLPRLVGADHSRTHDPRKHAFEIGPDQTQTLRQLAGRCQVTLNTMLQVAWGLLLSRYNDTDDVTFGSVVSGRPADLPGVADMVGVFINTVPVRIRFSNDANFVEVLQGVQEDALQGERFHQLPLAEIQASGTLGGNLFDHVIAFENYPRDSKTAQDDAPPGPGFTMQLVDIHDRTHYDFSLMIDAGEKIEFKFDYNANVHTPDQMRRIEQHFVKLLHGISADPEQRIADISLLPDTEHEQVTREFNQTTRAGQHASNIIEVFLEQVRQNPDAVALSTVNGDVSYRQLDARSSRIAHSLRKLHNVAANDRVGILADRSEQLVAGILGILKSGAAYVPIAPEDPIPRISHIVQDSGAAVVLVDDTHHTRLDGFAGAAVLSLDELANHDACNGNSGACAVEIQASDLAYVMYTSGSTGRPKGCQIGHDNLLNYLSWAGRYYFADDDRGDLPLYTSIAFDLTVTSLFLPLMRGKRVHIFPQQGELIDVLNAVFAENSCVDGIKLTPSHIALLKQMDIGRTDLGLAIVGGEALQADQARFLHDLNPRMRVVNEYGPTEATVGCIVHEIRPNDDRIYIGKPIDNIQAFILDRQGRPTPIGVTGELHISGDSVARGYLNQPELTAKSFTREPLLATGTLYHTGDLARWFPDGNIECLGRSDDQVKVRGHRIEPGEIENCLVEYGPIRSAAVVSHAHNGASSELVAYVECQDELDQNALRAHLRGTLPDHMIPAMFISIDALPLTVNGKLDRSALPDPTLSRGQQSTDRTAPRNHHEESLLEIWRNVLQIEEIGVHENFFAIGGHSLKAMQVVSRLQKDLGVKVALQSLFQLPTIAELATELDTADAADYSAIPPVPHRDTYELSHAQKRLWLLHQMQGDVAYNMPKALLFEEELDLEALRAAMETVVDRHEALRTAFILVDGEPRQQILSDVRLTIEDFDVSGHEDPTESARDLTTRAANEAFDLATPPLLRAAVIKLAESRYVTVLVMHHIIGDGWSMTVIYRELLAIYNARRHGLANPLEPLRIQYKDFAEWQNSRTFADDEAYWLRKLHEVPQRINLPYDFAVKVERDFQGDSRVKKLDEQTTAGIKQVARARNATTSDVVLSLLSLFLYQLTQQDDFCIGVSVACRNHPDLERLIGFFVNVLPVRSRFSDDMEFPDLLDQVKQNTQEALEHQEYPFDLLVQALNPERTANRQPLVNVIYGFQNFEDVQIDGTRHSTADADGDVFENSKPFEFDFETSKFDLTLFVYDHGNEITLTLEYDTGLFRAETIDRYLSSMERFAQMIATVAETTRATA